MSKIIKSQFVSQDGPIVKQIGVKSFQQTENILEPVENNQYLQEKELLNDLKIQIDHAQDQLAQLQIAMEVEKEKVFDEIELAKLNWQEEESQLRQIARDEGFQKGYLEGQEKGYEDYSGILSQANEVMSSAKTEFNRIISSSEESLVKLAIKISEQILGKILQENPEEFIHIAKRVIKEVKEHNDIQICVHPEQFSFVVAQREELQEMLIGEAKIYVYADEDLPQNACTIDSDFGKIDASVDTQLDEIRRKLVEMARERVHDES